LFSWKDSFLLLKLKDYINLEASINRRSKIIEGNIYFDSSWLEGLDISILKFYNKEEYILSRKNFILNTPGLIVQTFTNGKCQKNKFSLQNYLNDIAVLNNTDSLLNYFSTHVKDLYSEYLANAESNMLLKLEIKIEKASNRNRSSIKKFRP